MAYFRKVGKGWGAEIRANGIKRNKSGFKSKAEARRWAAKIEGEGDVHTGLRGTVGDILKKFRNEETTTRRCGSSEDYTLKAIMRRRLALVPLASLQPRHIVEYRDERLLEVKPGTVRRELGILSAAFNVAIKEWQWLTVNPCAMVRLPPPPKPRDRRPTAQELADIKKHTGYPAHKDARATTCAAFLFCCETAMRMGECLSIDSMSGNVAHLANTKNGDERDVPLTKAALKIYNDYAGFNIAPQNCSKLFRIICQELEIKDLHFHDSRREGTSRLAQKVDVMTLAKITGHKTIQILLNTYYTVDMQDVANRLD